MTRGRAVAAVGEKRTSSSAGNRGFGTIEPTATTVTGARALRRLLQFFLLRDFSLACLRALSTTAASRRSSSEWRSTACTRRRRRSSRCRSSRRRSCVNTRMGQCHLPPDPRRSPSTRPPPSPSTPSLPTVPRWRARALESRDTPTTADALAARGAHVWLFAAGTTRCGRGSSALTAPSSRCRPSRRSAGACRSTCSSASRGRTAGCSPRCCRSTRSGSASACCSAASPRRRRARRRAAARPARARWQLPVVARRAAPCGSFLAVVKRPAPSSV